MVAAAAVAEVAEVAVSCQHHVMVSMITSNVT